MLKTLMRMLFGLLLLALNWAALHDIFKGGENLVLEWLVLCVSFVLVATAAAKRITRRT